MFSIDKLFSSPFYPSIFPRACWTLDSAINKLASNYYIRDLAYETNVGKFVRDLILGDGVSYDPAIVLTTKSQVVEFLERLDKLAKEGNYIALRKAADRTAIKISPSNGKTHKIFKPYGEVLAYAYANKSNTLRDHWGLASIRNTKVNSELYKSEIRLGRHKLTFENGQLKLLNGAPINRTTSDKEII